MPPTSKFKSIDYLQSLTDFQHLVSKTQVMNWPLFAGNFSAMTSTLYSLLYLIFMQTDAYLFDSLGGSRPVHRSLLRVKSPLLRDLTDFDAVILDKVSPEEVDLLVELTYGMNRLHSIDMCL